MNSTFEHNQRTPEVSLEAHVRRTRVALGEAVTRKTVVYLDTNYWICLRQAAQGAPNADSAYATLLEWLRKAVAAGMLVCPISASTFLELMKQADPVSRLSTASLINELSEGVALIEEQERFETEIAYFIHAKSGDIELLHPLKHLVWCKLSYVLGFVHPTETPFDVATELAIQKAFFDHLWSRSLADIIPKLSDPSGIIEAGDFAAIAERLNQANALHAGDLRTYDDAYSAEVRGLVDSVGSMALDVLEKMARKRGFAVEDITETHRLEDIKKWKNLLSFALESDRARDILRTIHIHACLHASVRWNKKRKLKSNDLLDFHHAAAALAYCNAFFTERSLRTLATQGHLALDARYGCRVIASADDAVDYVRNLA
jgi:hypothetical protein